MVALVVFLQDGTHEKIGKGKKREPQTWNSYNAPTISCAPMRRTEIGLTSLVPFPTSKYVNGTVKERVSVIHVLDFRFHNIPLLKKRISEKL